MKKPRRSNAEELAPGRKQIAWISVLPMLGFFALVCLSPIGQAIQLGGDEHFELNKARLVHSGFRPYEDFWNDQPPGLTYLLAGVFEVFGVGIVPARLIVAVLTALSLLTLQWTWRNTPAKGCFFALFLFGAPHYLGYSFSVMADPVKIPLCILAYGLYLIAISRRSFMLGMFAGLMFGGAVLTKFTAALYLPGLILAGWFHLRDLTPKERGHLICAFLSGGALCLPYFVGLLLESGDQLLGSHFSPSISNGSQAPGEFSFGWHHIWPGLPLWLGGMTAAGLAAFKRLRLKEIGFPLAALATHLTVAVTHVPWWDYYLLDFWLILAWLSAAAYSAGLEEVSRWRVRRPVEGSGWKESRAFFAAMILGLVWLPVSALLNVLSERTVLAEKPQIKDSAIIQHLRRHPQPDGEVMFTDQPILAFHGGWSLPPDLTVLSLKRFWSGAIDTEGVIRHLEVAEPSLIYFAGPVEEIEGAYLKYAERRLGQSSRVGEGILFYRKPFGHETTRP